MKNQSSNVTIRDCVKQITEAPDSRTSAEFSHEQTSHLKCFPACFAALPEQDEFHLGGGAFNDGGRVLVTPPIKDLVVDLMDRQIQIKE